MLAHKASKWYLTFSIMLCALWILTVLECRHHNCPKLLGYAIEKCTPTNEK